MGGGGSHSTTYPQIPPMVRRMLEGTATRITEGQEDLPLTDFLEMDPRNVMGADPMQQAGYNAVGGLFAGGSPALTSAFDTASRLSQPTAWQGTDLSGVGRVGGISIGGPPPGGGSPPGGGGAPGGPATGPRPPAMPPATDGAGGGQPSPGGAGAAK